MCGDVGGVGGGVGDVCVWRWVLCGDVGGVGGCVVCGGVGYVDGQGGKDGN